MARTYRWLSFNPKSKGHGPVALIVSARSMAEVARIAGAKSTRALFNLSETGNSEEKALAEANPGVVYWLGINRDDPSEWQRDERFGPNTAPAQGGEAAGV